MQDSNGWLVFADPFHLHGDQWLNQGNAAWPNAPILGGLASGEHRAQRTQIYLNGDVYEDGGVALSVGGGVALRSVISQGCTPIGETWTITRAEHNVIHEIGNRPAYEVLVETFEALSDTDKEKTRGNLFVGMVVNEYLDEFHRGDFLIRNLIGAIRTMAPSPLALYRALDRPCSFNAATPALPVRILMNCYIAPVKHWRTPPCMADACAAAMGGQTCLAPPITMPVWYSITGRDWPQRLLLQRRNRARGREQLSHGYTASLALFVEKANA